MLRQLAGTSLRWVHAINSSAMYWCSPAPACVPHLSAPHNGDLQHPCDLVYLLLNAMLNMCPQPRGPQGGGAAGPGGGWARRARSFLTSYCISCWKCAEHSCSDERLKAVVQQALKEAGQGERGSLTLADFEAALRGADLSDMQVCCQTLQTTIIVCFPKPSASC